MKRWGLCWFLTGFRLEIVRWELALRYWIHGLRVRQCKEMFVPPLGHVTESGTNPSIVIGGEYYSANLSTHLQTKADIQCHLRLKLYSGDWTVQVPPRGLIRSTLRIRHTISRRYLIFYLNMKERHKGRNGELLVDAMLILGDVLVILWLCYQHTASLR